MRGSSRRTSRNRFLFRLALGLVGVIALFMLVPQLISGLAYTIMAPIDVATTWIRESGGSLPSYVRERRALDERIEELEQALAENKRNDLTLRTLQAENSELRSLLRATSAERIAATVVGRPPNMPYDLLQIDRGRSDGVVESAPVYLGYRQLIGVIAHTASDHSFVELVTSPGFETTVYIYGPDIFTRAEGYGGGVLRVRVPQGIALTEGNIVIAPALDSGIYGSISHIKTSPTQPEQYGFVVPTTAIASINKVSVGTRPATPVDFEAAQEIVEENRIGNLRINVPQGQLVTVSTSTATSTATSTP